MRRMLGFGLVLGFVLGACGPTGGGGGATGWNQNTGNGDSGTIVTGDGGTVTPDAYNGPLVTLQGTVWGPGKLFPVAGAVVAAYTRIPDPIPDHVYCDPCADPGVAYVMTNPDGSFELQLMPGYHYYLAVQKGQFRRVREYDAPPGGGTILLPDDYTTLPSRTDPANGDTIPKIALATGSYDHMEDIFGKVGMGSVNGDGEFNWGTEQGIFDVYYNGGHQVSQDFNDLIHDLSRLEQYHIVFVPCSDSGADYGNDQVQENIRQYVWDGGKWYVADWSEEFVENVWPEFLSFGNCGDDWGGGDESDCDGSPEYNSSGHAVDQDLTAWLQGHGIDPNSLELVENWDVISGMDSGFVGYDDELGTGPNHELYMPPKVWVEGNVSGFGTQPLTVSWPYNCGRVVYTTYHSVGSMGSGHSGLLPQEEILFYLVMEIGICQDTPIVK